MSLTGNLETNALGGGGFGGMGVGGAGYGGGFGGGGIGGFGLFGLIGLLGRRGLGGDDGGDNCAKEAALLAAIANSKDTTVGEGRGILAAITNNNNQVVAEGRLLQGAICEAEKTNLQQFYAAAIQASNNTQAIKDQATAIAIVADKRFDDIALAGVTQTAAILARINQTEVDNLRDQLELSRHGLRSKETEITITNNNNAIANAMQQQQQQQLVRDFEHQRRFDSLFSQQAKAGQDIIAVGSLLAGTTQTANPVNVKS